MEIRVPLINELTYQVIWVRVSHKKQDCILSNFISLYQRTFYLNHHYNTHSFFPALRN